MKRSSESVDFSLFLAISGLIIFGLMMISSVSVYSSFQLTSRLVRQGVLEATSNDFYLWRHLFNVILAFPVMYFASKIHFSVWKKLALPLFITSVFLLVLVLIPGLSNDYGSARSWLYIPFLPSFQPSELAKFGLIVYLSIWMDKKVQAISTFQEGFLPFVVLLSLFVILIGIQPDFGAVLVIGGISMSLFFIAGGNLLHIFFGTFIASLFAWPVVLSHEYIRLRLLSFLDHTIDPQGAGYQIKQALMTIGSGQWFGVGFGKSVQKFGYLPEVQGDTIFAIASEELGFVFIVLFISLFLFIAFKGYMVALRAPDRFSKLLATGVTSWIFVQSFLHISVNLAIFPLTGVTLPFVSYGGTSLLIMAFASGVLLNISRYASKEDSLFTEWRGVRRSHHTINRPYDLPKREVSGV